ncbi:MAG: peptidoglycan-associated lipoprotein Pal [Myxococcota bacterium]|nr:peptidoglycan-associated lipoprotein Pal [Myxococcota bacterium]
MERAQVSRFLIVALLSSTLASGCALFGGGDDESAGTAGSSTSGGFDSGGGTMGGGGGLDSTDQLATGAAVAELEAVYFDFDRSLVRDDQKPKLHSNAQAISAGSWSTVVIEGHCDERGSEEYNLALGERRANAAKQYLIDSGVSASRLDTVSFGESKPSVQGHDESAWRWNRRAEFRVLR